MNILRESMTRVETGWFAVRVWRQEESLISPPDNKDMTSLILEMASDNSGKLAPTILAQNILKIDRVNAVEVLDKMGNGEVVYKNWP